MVILVGLRPGQSVELRDDAAHVTGAPADSATLSMWTSGLCSPFVTWGQRAETYLTALHSGDHGRIQTAMNAGFGECHAMTASGDVPDWQEILERRQPYRPGDERCIGPQRPRRRRAEGQGAGCVPSNLRQYSQNVGLIEAEGSGQNLQLVFFW
jgi:hypothetical protein